VELIRSFGYAFRGIWYSLHGRNMLIHLAATLVVIGLAVAYSVTGVHAVVLVISVVVVLGFEAMNTAVEKTCDLIEKLHGLPRPDYRIQVIKDLAAGAVLLVAMGAAASGWIVAKVRLVELRRFLRGFVI